jgi:hypothetical protein
VPDKADDLELLERAIQRAGSPAALAQALGLSSEKRVSDLKTRGFKSPFIRIALRVYADSNLLLAAGAGDTSAEPGDQEEGAAHSSALTRIAGALRLSAASLGDLRSKGDRELYAEEVARIRARYEQTIDRTLTALAEQLERELAEAKRRIIESGKKPRR